MVDKPVDLDSMTTEELQKYAESRRQAVQEAEGLRDTLERAFLHTQEVPASVPLTAESAKHLVAVSEAILLDATIQKAQEEAEKFKTKQEARNQRIKNGNPLPGDVPWEVPRETRPSGPRQETSDQRRSARPMWKVNVECPICHKHVSEVPFSPTLGKPIYCQDCAREQRLRRTPQGNVGDAVQKAVADKDKQLADKDQRIRDLEERLADQSVSGPSGGKMPPGLSKKKQKEWRSQHRGEQVDQD